MKSQDDWREKYLDSLEEIDQLQSQLENRRDSMRKALVRVIVAAKGQNPELDLQLDNLKSNLHDEGLMQQALDSVDRAIMQLDQPETSFPVSPQESVDRESAPSDVAAEINALVDRARSLLLDMVINIEPADCVRQRALQAQELLQSSLEQAAFLPALESVRDLVLQSYLHADQQHREYLLNMHGQLHAIVGGITNLQTHCDQESHHHQQFEQRLQGEVDAMAVTLRESSSLELLKGDINRHLNVIQGVLAERPLSSQLGAMRGQLDELQSKLHQMEQESAEFRQELESQKAKALTDTLTGLPNREAYNQRAFDEKQRQNRFNQQLCLVVCDIDHFKRINDSFGHQAGDRVLSVLAKTLVQRLRAVDFIARYGGEEFVILLPDTPLDGAWHLMEQIRTAIATAPLRFQQNPLQVSLSMGVVEVKADESIEQAFQRADQLLYVAKAEGRNRCVKETD